MSNLNSKYIPLNFLQQYFVDKDSGMPLSGGIVKFFEDESRTTAKNVFKLSGTPPNYSYTNLGSELTLSASGTFVDESGNDITVYAYPYDATGTTVQLYFIQVYAASPDGGVTEGVFQWAREAVPNEVSSSTGNALEGKNYIINGQFTLYNQNIVPDLQYDVSSLNSDNLALFLYGHDLYKTGSWRYHNEGSPSGNVDYLTLKKFSTGDLEVEGDPLNYVSFQCSNIGSGVTSKYLMHSFGNVQTFAGQTISFCFWAKSSTASVINVLFDQNFGSGGSSTVSTLLISQQLSSNFSKYYATISIPSIDGKTVATDGTDRIDLLFSYPVSSICEIDICNVQINLSSIEYPYEYKTWEEEEVINKALQLPTLPSFYKMTLLPHFGQDIYISEDLQYYSDDAVCCNAVGGFRLLPRAPIASTPEYWIESANPEGYINISNNSTNFYPTYTFNRLYQLIGKSYGTNTYNNNLYVTNITNNVITVSMYGNGTVETPSAGTSGFTINVTQVGDGSKPEIFTITCVAASNLAGKYITFETPATNKWYIWFRVSGIGTDPAPNGYDWKIGSVFLNKTDTANQVATKLGAALNPLLFYLPPISGLFTRVMNYGNGVDPDSSSRTNRGDGTTGDHVGTHQNDEFKAHNHSYVDGLAGGGQHEMLTGQGPNFGTGATTNSGGNETRPKNIYVNKLIKY